MISRPLAGLAALLLLAAAGPARADDDAVAVLSAAGGAYLEAFSSFQAAYGSGVRYFDASREEPVLPPGTKTVVAFGARAAARRYPPGVNLVYALAPGFFVDAAGRQGRTVKISMRLAPQRTLAKLAELQPGLKRLRIFWTTPGYAGFAEEYPAAGRGLGLEVSVVRVSGQDSLPGLLRASLGSADALWLPPDPLLITPDTLLMMREFAWGNSLPLYASTKGLAREGACASVGVSFAESGAAAAWALKALQAGQPVPALVYPDKLELALNAAAAKRCGLKFSPELTREAAYLFP